MLVQKGPWTYGLLANHIWSVAGDSDRPGISNTFLQPLLSHTTPTAWTNTESTYDWKNTQWSVPINAGISKLLKVDGQPVSMAYSHATGHIAPILAPTIGGHAWSLP